MKKKQEVPWTEGYAKSMVTVRPAAEGFGPWSGVVIDSATSHFGSLIDKQSSSSMVLVRCLNAMGARGMKAGEDYYVCKRFVFRPSE